MSRLRSSRISEPRRYSLVIFLDNTNVVRQYTISSSKVDVSQDHAIAAARIVD